MNNYNHIPVELQQYRQWSVFSVLPDPENPSELIKVPINGATPTDPATWTDYLTAVSIASTEAHYFLTFCLTAEDPFVVIDLDKTSVEGQASYIVNNHKGLMKYHAGTYMEQSASKTGSHIWTRWAEDGTAQPPNRKFKDYNIEVYSHSRFIIMGLDGFGATIEPRNESIKELLDHLDAQREEEARDNNVVIEHCPLSPTELLSIVLKGHKNSNIRRLVEGNFTNEDLEDSKDNPGNPGYSETSGKLMVAIAAETDLKDPDALIQAFHHTAWFLSPLYRTHYANKNRHKLHQSNNPRWWVKEAYTAITKAQGQLAHKRQSNQFGAQLAASVIEAHQQEKAEFETPEFKAELQSISSEETDDHAKSLTAPSNEVLNPPGKLLKELIAFNMKASIMPNPPVCLASALHLLASWTGSRYQTFNLQGLTFYGLLFGASRIGKSDAKTAQEVLFRALRHRDRNNDDFIKLHQIKKKAGSGVGLARMMYGLYEKNNNTLSVGRIENEVGEIFAAAKKQGSATRDILTILLQAYDTSGMYKSLDGMGYSDQEKDMESMDAANFTFLGEGTPESVFDGLTEKDVHSGLLPRFFFFDCGDKEPDMNFAQAQPQDVPEYLLDTCTKLMAHIEGLEAASEFHIVPMDPDAGRWYQSTYIPENQKRRNALDRTSHKRVLLGGFNLMILRLASLAAISKDIYNPKVDMECLQWAQAFLEHSLEVICTTMGGELDLPSLKREKTIATKIIRYLDSSNVKGGVQLDNRRTPKMVELGYINKAKIKTMLGSTPSGFSHEDLGHKDRNDCVNKVFKDFIDEGILIEIDQISMKTVEPLAPGGIYYRLMPNMLKFLEEKATGNILE